MYLKNLNALYIDMQKNGADSVVFAAQVEGHPFSCAFATVTGEFHLFVTTLGENPFTIDIQVDSNFNVAFAKRPLRKARALSWNQEMAGSPFPSNQLYSKA